MEYSEEMTTSINDLKLAQQPQQNLGQKMENELDNFDYNPDVIPQSTLQKAPPMRYGKLENFPTHQVVRQNNFYPQLQQTPEVLPKQIVKEESPSLMEGILSGIYQRLLDPILLTVLFVILAHRMVAKGINPYLPFVGMSPSTDLVSLGLRGFILSVVYLMIRNNLV